MKQIFILKVGITYFFIIKTYVNYLLIKINIMQNMLFFL